MWKWHADFAWCHVDRDGNFPDHKLLVKFTKYWQVQRQQRHKEAQQREEIKDARQPKVYFEQTGTKEGVVIDALLRPFPPFEVTKRFESWRDRCASGPLDQATILQVRSCASTVVHMASSCTVPEHAFSCSSMMNASECA
jgi:hypothetical protein